MYMLRKDIDKNDFLDGRTIMYVSKKIGYNRENISKVLRHKGYCNYKKAMDMLRLCKPDAELTDYFEEIEREG